MALAVHFDGYRENQTLKALASLREEAAGEPLFDEDAELDAIRKFLALHGRI